MSEFASIMDRLRCETRLHHERAEHSCLEQSLLAATLPKEVYVNYLSQRFIIHHGLEGALLRLAARDRRLDGLGLPLLFQEDNLRDDLSFFGVDAGGIVPCTATRALLADLHHLATEKPAGLLGAYYVFEGSKNGAAFLARSIRRAFALTDGSGLRYLDPHGEAQRRLWHAFRAAMAAIPFTPSEAEQIVAAAKLTFDRVRELDDELWSNPGARAEPQFANDTGENP
jgi:heme oxygenase